MLQRGRAIRHALRHKSAPRHIIRRGRGASRTACPTQSMRNDNLTIVRRSG
ncbi:DUF1534 domain-containing protein, partial [Pseudomonas syringae pv. theae]|nr:DUF1534 domain-containing protein [Pseudomonas syringae pv. theae]